MKSFPLSLTSSTIKPARLCVITRRDGAVLRIAEAQSAIVQDGDTYTPVDGLKMSAVRHTINGEVPSMEIQGAQVDAGVIDTAVIDKGLYDSATVQVYIVNRDDLTDKGLLFTGTIQPISFDTAGNFVFDVRGPAVGAVGSFMQQFAPMCRTDLFSTLCQVNSASFNHTCQVATIIDNHTFTVSGMASPPADEWFNNGAIVTADGVAFVCANWVLSTLTVKAYLPCRRLLEVGMNLTMYAGCDKRIATCNTKFSNAINFQAEPHSLGIYALPSG
jgi:uncharacterized phage protein (TIGR02218 family)